MIWIKAAVYTAYVPLLIAAGYAAWLFRGLPATLQRFGWFVFLTALAQLSSLALSLVPANNMPILHAYVVLGFGVLCWAYAGLLHGYVPRWLLPMAGVGFAVFSLLNSWFFESVWSFNALALTVESVLMVILSLSTYVLLLNAHVQTVKGASLASLNWLNGGFFIYYSSTLLLFHAGPVIMEALSVRQSHLTWILHSVVAAVLYVTWILALWNRPRN